MSGGDCDIAVVGAGIHGCGVALVAAAAGYSVTLVERTAPAAGTSGKSSKLIHGGLRYLETGHLRLVRESLRERRWLLEHAPGLVEPMPMYIPVYTGAKRSAAAIRAGLSVYAMLGGLRTDARFTRVPRGGWDALDGLSTDGLEAVFRYQEARTDDAALTRAVLEAAVRLGADTRMPVRMLTAEIDEAGVTVICDDGKRRDLLRARALVNAAGPWAGEVAANIHPAPPPPAFELVQGSHLEFAGALELGGYYLEAPDGRGVFALPRGGGTLVGTTEQAHLGDPSAAAVTDPERAYLQDVLASYFPARRGERPVADWCGLRVLPAVDSAAFTRSRETMVHLDRPRGARMVGVFGGKLTTWRATARKVLAKLVPVLPVREQREDIERVVLR